MMTLEEMSEVVDLAKAEIERLRALNDGLVAVLRGARPSLDHVAIRYGDWPVHQAFIARVDALLAKCEAQP